MPVDLSEHALDPWLIFWQIVDENVVFVERLDHGERLEFDFTFDI